MTSITTVLKRIDAEFLFTDTNSLTYEIKSENVYEDFYKNWLFDWVTIQKIQSFLILPMKKLLAKWQMCLKEDQTINSLA